MDRQFTNLDSEPELWFACAGPLVQIPLPNSLVYYFIQGHLEHCCVNAQERATLNCLFATSLQPRMLCRVQTITFLADPETDQVFTKIKLKPIENHSPITPNDSLGPNLAPKHTNVKIYSEAKIRECLERTTTLLRRTKESTVKKDLHNFRRRFIYIPSGRVGDPHLHRSWESLLFRKRVLEGDTIVLMNDRRGGERYGVLRGKRRIINAYGLDKDMVTNAVAVNFNMPFEVYYYPRNDIPEFVVNAARVEAAMKIPWEVGMKFSMKYEDDHEHGDQYYPLLRTCTGTVSSVKDVDHKNWPNSPWKMLQVKLDPPYLNQNEILVNPWMLKLQEPGESSSSRSRNLDAEMMYCRVNYQNFDVSDDEPQPHGEIPSPDS